MSGAIPAVYSPPPKRIFLTGAAGVLGGALLEALSTEKIVALRHRQPLDAAGIETVAGSIGAPRLGLSERDYRRIVGGTDAVVHCASLTQFVGGESRIRAVNVEGARRVLELARAANAPLYYVSTAFVHTRATGIADDNAYIASKREAERILRASGHPLTILRPSIISGDSTTGYMPRHQGYHALLRLVLREALPVLPIDESSYVDVMPRDVVARLIAAIVRRGPAGGDYWLTLGKARAPSAHRLLERLLSVVEDCRGTPLAPPKFVSTDMFERLIRPAILPSLPRQLIKDYHRLEKIEAYFSLPEPLPSSLDALARRGVAIGHGVYDAFERDVRRLIEAEARAVPAFAAHAASLHHA